MITIEAPAKINLRLKIVGRRADGYHLLSMLNCCCSLCDQLEVELNDTSECVVTFDPDQKLLALPTQKKLLQGLVASPQKSSVYVAWEAFCAEFTLRFGLVCHVQKRIPSGAGLGGGSSDGAALIAFLAQTFRSTLLQRFSAAELETRVYNLLRRLGSDYLTAYMRIPVIAEGVGDIVTPLTLPAELLALHWYLIMPDLVCLSSLIYEQYRELYPEIPVAEDPLLRIKSRQDSALPWPGAELIQNDLFEASATVFPVLSQLVGRLRVIPGVIASQTGSGSAFFVLAKENSHDRILRELESFPLKTTIFDVMPLLH
jgi:4-diphosphocytidyl-2-C-methyl-D-erythritol kinase